MDIEETKERDCKSLSLMKQLIRSDAAKLLSQLVGSEYAEDILNNKAGADETIGDAVVNEVTKHAINTDSGAVTKTSGMHLAKSLQKD